MSNTTTARLLQHIADQQTSMEQRLRQWAQINSGSTHLAGLATMAAELQQALQTLTPDEISLHPAESYQTLGADGHWHTQDLGQTLVARKNLSANKRVLLCGHMDTVFAADHRFQTLTDLDHNTLQGPGVSDMKGGLVIMLAALAALEAANLSEPLGWDIIINADEELGSIGSRPVLERIAKQHQVGLVFEPSLTPAGDLAGARKGSATFNLIAHGKAAHVGRAFADGRNAIMALADCSLKIAALTNDDQSLTVNVGRIIGGGPSNVVPDHCACQINIRVSDHQQMQIAEQAVADIVSQYQADGLSIECQGGFTRPPKVIDQRSEQLFHLVADCAKALDLSINWHATGGVCDGNNLAACGVAVVDTLGARGGNIHSDQEYILLDSLVERAQLTALVLHHLASKGLS